MDIVEFLTDRYDEIDSALADQLEPQAQHERAARGRRPDEVGGIRAQQMREHVKAWRNLLTEIDAITIRVGPGYPDDQEHERPAGRMLRTLAAAWFAHPDYDPAWRVS